MAEYMPTTDQVREAWVDQTGIASRRQMHRDDFNRWLAAYEAEVRERIAQDIEAATPTREDLGEGGLTLGAREGMIRAASIARGATR